MAETRDPIAFELFKPIRLFVSLRKKGPQDRPRRALAIVAASPDPAARARRP
jgi:hypothetical protein